jgi:hypothetical protein
MRGRHSFVALALTVPLLAAAVAGSSAVADPPFDFFRPAPKPCAQPTVESLARSIDCVEEQINTYGTVVAKQPDVWGEARLTRHRDEYEKEMRAELDNFQVRLSAAVSRSDSAFFGAAAALQSAATAPASSSSSSSTGSSSGSSGSSSTSTPFSVVQNLIGDPNTEQNLVPRTGPTNFFASGAAAPSLAFFGSDNPSLSLEPEVILEQKSRYLLYLQELRRINEGDDTRDSPGYSLNLIRIPISVIPGKKTRKGYGAEITITAEPFLSPDLLPTTFRSLVINDTVDQLSRDVTVYLNSPKAKFTLEVLRWVITNHYRGKVKTIYMKGEIDITLLDDVDKALHERADFLSAAKNLYPHVNDVDENLARECLFGFAASNYATVPSEARPFQRPLAPSKLDVAYGEGLLLIIDNDIDSRVKELPTNSLERQVLDVRALLQEETAGAYEMLRRNPELWNFCTPNLLCAIREGRSTDVNTIRTEFFHFLPPQAAVTIQAALAWGIIVHATLLNQRLNDDIREASVARGAPISVPPNGLCLFPPEPDQATRQIFNEYVRCRWPIHVFALDPVTQDENVADAFSRRREEQLAMALAFTSGKINASAMTRFDRRLEWDMATIALNRTAIGFSHNNDTFGWRFYPRFQTPPIKGSIKTFGETVFGGPTTDQDIRDRQLEEGMRDCTAVVIMPSFVPFVTVQTRANWFKLTNPARTELSMADTVQMSRQIKSMENASMQLCNAPQFRDGDAELLISRVHQLSHQLPLQSMLAQVPIENTLGGFEMFTNGVTDLAPELIGWYGAPGINPQEPTKLFLVGDHFSVHDTECTAGGQQVGVQLLSRQIMEVTIPPGVQTIRSAADNSLYPPATPSTTPKDGLVAVHIATPYGVSSTLEIPLVSRVVGAQNFRWDPQNYAANYRWSVQPASGGGSPTASIVASFPMLPNQMTITVPPNAFAAMSQKADLFFTDEGNRSMGTQSVTLALDPQSRRYVIAGSDFQALQTNLAAAIPKLFPSKNNQPPQFPPSVTVKVFARFSSTDNSIQLPTIEGSAYIYIRLEQVQ